jgi:hypothetical protein
MKLTIYLTAIEARTQDLREIRAQSTHSLLALAGKDGILLWDRRSRTQHVLRWADVVDLYQQSQQSEPISLQCTEN